MICGGAVRDPRGAREPLRDGDGTATGWWWWLVLRGPRHVWGTAAVALGQAPPPGTGPAVADSDQRHEAQSYTRLGCTRRHTA